MFIEMHNKRKFKPDKIIEIINENDEINMVKLYIYKIIYNKNKKQINTFVNSDIINKYKLKTYKGFGDFIKSSTKSKTEIAISSKSFFPKPACSKWVLESL